MASGELSRGRFHIGRRRGAAVGGSEELPPGGPTEADPTGRSDDDAGDPSGQRLRERPAAARYVSAVVAAGLALLVYLSVADRASIGSTSGAFWLFFVLLVVGELFPIRVQRGREVDEITTSTTFAFALLLGFGIAAAAIPLAVGSAAADFVRRKPLWKILFNVAQYSIAISVAGVVYHGLTSGPPAMARQLPAILLASFVFFALNTLVTSVAVGLALGAPLLEYVVKDFAFQAYTASALLALSPVVVLAAEVSLWFVPLLVVPVAAVYWGATVALENVRLVHRLRGSLAHMTELNRAKDDFVAVVSHELRTPLTSIQGYIKTMLQLATELDGEQRRAFLEAADRQGERLRRLIEQLLVVARLESHVEPLAVSSVQLPVLVSHVVDELRPRAHGHTFDIRFPANFSEVETDEAKIHQILSNLVENALKYAPPDTRVTIEGQPSLNGVVISVSDEGHGIPPDSQERVFERFFQVDSSTTRSVGGTGLGLYICKKMAEMIGARLWLDRSDPTGSTFSLLLPLRPPEEDEDDLTPGPGARADQSMTARV